MSRYLITGGLGVIGSNMARRLLERGHEVVIIDACEAKRSEWTADQLRKDYFNNLAIWRGRVEQGVDLRGIEYVIHAAASTGIPYSIQDPDGDWRANVDATKVLLDALRKGPIPTVVISSIKPYWVPPRASLRGGLDEHALLSPDEPYAASKASQSMLAVAYAKSYDLPVTVLRCSNLVGPGACHGPRHGWATWFAISAAIGRPIEVQGTGSQARDLLHADDVLTACLSCFAYPDRTKGEIFNIGGGLENVVSVNEVAEYLRELTGIEIKSAPARAMDDDLVFVNYEKLRLATGWSPAAKAMDSVREILEWATQHKAALREIYASV